MSSFSSVVQKPGKKIVPKVAPRRNVHRKNTTNRVSNVQNTVDTGVHTEDHNTQDISSLQPDLSETGVEPFPQEDSSLILEGPTHITSQSGTAGQDVIQEPLIRETGIPLVQISTSESHPTVLDSGSVVSLDAGNEVLTGTAIPISVPTTNQIREQHATSVVGELESRQNSTGANSNAYETPRPADRSRVRKHSSNRIEAPSNPRKRRKTTPNDANTGALAQETLSSQLAEGIQSSTSTQTQHNQHEQESQPADDLLASATRRAASVSEMANNIESQTRLLRQPLGTNSILEDESANPLDGTNSSPSHPTSRRNRKTVTEQAIEVVANAIGKSAKSPHQRAGTPEDAESYELEPTKVTMGQLCEDRKLGKKSTLESEMQANWSEILQRRKEDKERAMINAENRRRKGFGSKFQLPDPTEAVTALAPAMAVVNGVIVVDQASREIDRSAQLQQAAIQDLDHVREDRNYYKYVNSGTVGIKPGHGQHARWDEESNERFFKGLRMFGTDFLMIANMFPGLSRRQIKTKFIREENADKSRVLECLRNREPVQLEDYAEMANKDTDDFQTLETIQKELDAQEKRLRDEDNQRRKREGFLAADVENDNAQPVAQEPVEANQRQSESNEPGRFDAAAKEIVEAAVAPKKKKQQQQQQQQQQQRKTNTSVSKSKRGLKSSRRAEGGIEEVLGSIDEVAV